MQGCICQLCAGCASSFVPVLAECMYVILASTRLQESAISRSLHIQQGQAYSSQGCVIHADQLLACVSIDFSPSSNPEHQHLVMRTCHWP